MENQGIEPPTFQLADGQLSYRRTQRKGLHEILKKKERIATLTFQLLDQLTPICAVFCFKTLLTVQFILLNLPQLIANLF